MQASSLHNKITPQAIKYKILDLLNQKNEAKEGIDPHNNPYSSLHQMLI